MILDDATMPPRADPLHERDPDFAGLGANRADRRRSQLLAGRESAGLSAAELPYAVEALQTGQSAYTLAAGAKALRGSTPVAWMLPLIDRALQAVRRVDATICFDAPEAPSQQTHRTTALGELAATRDWLLRSLPSATGDCCEILAALGRARTDRDLRLDQVIFEDQSGRRVAGRELLTGKPSVIAFFYTRCENAAKCSLTMTQLGHLQHALAGEGVDARILAITYDPAYDTPDRLRAYAISRGFSFGADARALRAVAGMDRLSATLALGVNYGPVTVNLHRIELFVLDARGRLQVSFTRLQWSVDAVVAAVREAATPSSIGRLRRMLPVVAGPAGIVTAFVPHCPLCWSAYATAAGIPGLALASPAWFHRGAWLLLGLNAVVTLMALRRSRASVLGGLLMLVATSLLAVGATVPTLTVTPAPVCLILAAGVVLALRRQRPSSRAAAHRFQGEVSA